MTNVRNVRRYYRPVLDALEQRQHLSRSQVVGYLTNYGIDDGHISVDKIDFSALTQLNYFAAIPSDSGEITFSTAESNRLHSIVAKAHSYGVKVSLVLGGAGQDASLLAIIGTNVGGNTTASNHLASEINDVQAEYGIDGIDVDWEPLSTTTTAITNYGALLQNIQSKTTVQLSAAVNPEMLYDVVGAPGGRAYVLDQVGITALDQIGIMAYDLDYADHSTYARATGDLNAWITTVEGFGKSREKLLLGVPFYAHAGTSWGNSQTQPYREIVNAALAQEQSTAAAANVSNLAFDGFFDGATVPWYYNGKTTISSKTTFAIDNNVGGVMIWDLAHDHTDASLSYTNYSLLPAIRTTVNARGTLTATTSFSASAQKKIAVTFSAGIDASSVGPADLELKNLATGALYNTATLSTLSYNATTKVATWTLANRLPDGNYRATIRAGSARDASGNAMKTDATSDFFVLGGDANHDRVVNFDDLVPLSQNYNTSGKTYAQGDFTGDGIVNFDDLVILSQNYNKTIAAPATLVAATFSKTPVVTKTRVAGDVLR